ncbi:hypothetical protein JKP88DRAFT_279820 [Tribonema minus]|uniref:Glutathione S-transferase n=1 Tax=Tribonema minus TaxID=303371 RepID=A0A835YRK5_9STRA|nr:hypothetical protein JKP88DRAFT_279820 [Tribonema minus]
MTSLNAKLAAWLKVLYAPCASQPAQTMASLNAKLGGPVKLSYFDVLPVGGRGGQVRFLLLALGIKFEEDLFGFDAWPARKQALIDSGDNPCGAVPILQIGDLKLFQSVSMMRYVCSVSGVGPTEPIKMYQQDALADEYTQWRVQWIGVVFAAEDKKPALLADYVAALPKRYATFEGMYAKFATGSTPYAGGGPLPLHGDACVFSQLYDDRATKLAALDMLEQYPRLKALYAAVAALPDVAAWLAKHAA